MCHAVEGFFLEGVLEIWVGYILNSYSLEAVATNNDIHKDVIGHYQPDQLEPGSYGLHAFEKKDFTSEPVENRRKHTSAFGVHLSRSYPPTTVNAWKKFAWKLMYIAGRQRTNSRDLQESYEAKAPSSPVRCSS